MSDFQETRHGSLWESWCDWHVAGQLTVRDVSGQLAMTLLSVRLQSGQMVSTDQPCSFKAGLLPFLWQLVLYLCLCVLWRLDAQSWHLWLFIWWYGANWFMWSIWEICALSGILLTKVFKASWTPESEMDLLTLSHCFLFYFLLIDWLILSTSRQHTLCL